MVARSLAGLDGNQGADRADTSSVGPKGPVPRLAGPFRGEEMFTRLNAAREDREAGFTLIELLVVVAIIGILAAIAIPLFLSQRDNAAVSGVEAEVKNAATQIEVYYTENGSYPADEEADAGVNWSANVGTVTYTPDNASDPNTYTLTATVTEAGDCVVAWDQAAGTFDAANSTC